MSALQLFYESVSYFYFTYVVCAFLTCMFPTNFHYLCIELSLSGCVLLPHGYPLSRQSLGSFSASPPRRSLSLAWSCINQDNEVCLSPGCRDGEVLLAALPPSPAGLFLSHFLGLGHLQNICQEMFMWYFIICQ